VLPPGGVKSEEKKIVNSCGLSLYSASSIIPESEETKIKVRVKL
jgi:hypothetical protein